MANFDPSIFPKDLTMTLESNHIINEVKEFANREDFIFVPNGGPFYSDSLIIKNTQNGQLLKPIIDYQLLYLNEQATMESNKNVVAVIRVLNTTVPSVNLNYRVIGGEYGNTVAGILQELRNAGPLDNNVDWEVNVFKKPEVFPAAPHYHNANDFTDWSNVWVQLEGIRTAIIHSDLPSWASVYRYFDLRLQATTNLYQNTLNSLPKIGYTYTEADAKFVSWDELGSWMDANYYNISQINTQVNAINNSITSGNQNTLAAAKSYTDNKLAIAVANANNYANQMLSDAKAYTDSKLTGQNPSLSIDDLLADPRFQQYKVGDIFATTNNYADGAAVRAALGYGTWTRYAQGRVIIGQTTSAVVDEANISRTFNLGQIGGEYQHGLTVDEMPIHDHAGDVFNKLAGISSDLLNAGYTSIDSGFTSGAFDNDVVEHELATGGLSKKVISDSIIQSVGGNQPHNNIQPFIVAGVWLRLPDVYVAPTFNTYWTTDVTGMNKVTGFSETDNIYLWIEASGISGNYPISLINVTATRSASTSKLQYFIDANTAKPTSLVNGKNMVYALTAPDGGYFSGDIDLTVDVRYTDTVINQAKRITASTTINDTVQGTNETVFVLGLNQTTGQPKVIKTQGDNGITVTSYDVQSSSGSKYLTAITLRLDSSIDPTDLFINAGWQYSADDTFIWQSMFSSDPSIQGENTTGFAVADANTVTFDADTRNLTIVSKNPVNASHSVNGTRPLQIILSSDISVVKNNSTTDRYDNVNNPIQRPFTGLESWAVLRDSQ